MTIDQIAEIIRRDHGGAYWALFKQTDHGHFFWPTGDTLTPAAYDEIRRRFAPVQPSEELTPEVRKRNSIRAMADRADRYGR